jgi:hypothetical protein
MSLQTEVILMLENRGEVLETARRVSAILRKANVDAAVIGGVAVFLHGYKRTTADVDVFVADSLQAASDALEGAGLKFDAGNREFRSGEVSVQLVEKKLVKPVPIHRATIDQIVTISLADLINLKVKSGTGNVKRTQDIADVVGLIQANHLTSAFAAKVAKELRPEFRKLVKAVRS